MQFDRATLMHAIDKLVRLLIEQGHTVDIHIIGGAALNLAYYERRMTSDIDARTNSDSVVYAAVLELAQQNGWPEDWFNSNAASFIPFTADEWALMISEEGVNVYVAEPELLLAMKLNAARPGRDTPDIAALMHICAITDLQQADELFEQRYLGECMKDDARKTVQALLAQTQPPPVRVTFTPAQ